MLKRFAILMSPQGYEMSIGIPDGPVEVLSDERAEQHIQIIYVFTRNGEIPSGWNLNRAAKDYKISYMSKRSQEQGGFNIGSMMAYNMRKNMAQVPGQVEYIFALNQDDMDWIYQRNPIDAGLILCELFMNTKPDDMVHKEIEGRNIIGFNKCADDYWDKVKYDLEDFYDIYTTKKRTLERRAARG